MSYQKYVAECIGTFALSFIVFVSVGAHFAMPTPVLAALTVGAFVYIIGPISGTHLNPAVTIGLLSIRKISGKDASFYILAQIIGALIASAVGSTLVSPLGLTVVDSSVVFGVEALGAFFLLFGISAVVYGKVHSAASGVVIGTSLLIGIMSTAGMSNGVLNPAVALAIGSLSWVYLLGPIVGAVIACHLYKALVEPMRKLKR